MRQTFSDVYHCKTFDGWSGVEACALITVSMEACISVLMRELLNC